MIKNVCVVLALIVAAAMLPRCKKNNPAPPPTDEDSIQRLEPGRYIIRTKYICNDGAGFILRSASNYEMIKWEWTVPENVQWQKESGEYIWTVQEVKARSNSNGTSLVRVGYSLYQSRPFGGHLILAMGRPAPQPDDDPDHGFGPTEALQGFGREEKPEELIEGKSAQYIQDHPEYLNEPSFIFAIRSPTDSTHRMYNRGYKLGLNGLGWNDWVVSASADPDGNDCENYKDQPVMRNQIVGKGCTYLPNPATPNYVPDVCYLTQLVFEKVD